MNRKVSIVTILVPCMLMFIHGTAFSRESNLDSLVMARVFDYRRNYAQHIEGTRQNVYLKWLFAIEQRNALLYLVPTMHTIAHGSRNYIGEAWCKLDIATSGERRLTQQIVSGTIHGGKHKTMPGLMDYIAPNLYDISLFEDHILSPFNRHNRVFYKYRVVDDGNNIVRLHYKPRKIASTQLIKGSAQIDLATGRILSIEMEGEYDMMEFRIVSTYSRDQHPMLPVKCRADARFHFMGNHVAGSLTALFGQETSLPDSVINIRNRQQMERLRPVALTPEEQAIYDVSDARRHAGDSTETKRERRERTAWESIAEILVKTQRTANENASIKMSPLINPGYISYSQRHGVSYKVKIGARYNFSPRRYLTLDPRLSYNFKYGKFYFSVPLRMTYNPHHNGYAEIKWSNGNRITNSSITDYIRREHPEEFNDLDKHDLEYFDDNSLQLTNNIQATKWLEIAAGILCHHREAAHKTTLKNIGMPTEYRSCAPLLSLTFRPWRRGPVIRTDYERSIRGLLGSNMEYERWESDALYTFKLPRMRSLGLRAGGGLYTNRRTSYFIDYSNFRDVYLPEAWDDEWTGQFQLLRARWYNASDHYLRAHVAYESPLLLLSWIPVAGRFIENERLYAGALALENTRPYYELGYSLTNRIFSVGLFASFLGTKPQDVGCKFTIELFQKW